jgi:hypothetical protein
VKDTDVWIGISLDEAERMKGSGLKWYRHVYPLIDARMSRMDCINQVQRYGWEVPHKSRCYMCPNQSEIAWRELKRRGDGDFEKTVAMEREIRLRDPNMYLHRLAIPVDEAVEVSEGQYDMFDGCDSGYCMT